LPARLLDFDENVRRAAKRDRHLASSRTFAQWLPLNDAEAVAMQIESTARFREPGIAVLRRPGTLSDRQERAKPAFALEKRQDSLDIIGPYLPSRKCIGSLPARTREKQSG